MAAQASILSKRQQNRRTEQTTAPAEEQIRVRAYQIYLQRGDQSGSEIQDWLQAEAELNSGIEGK
jgi:Protein of unknown function (DUF2934)